MVHPHLGLLSRFSDRELPRLPSRLITAHLQRCGTCRAAVAAMRSWSEAAPSLATPRPPAHTLPEVLERRRRGERVILPVADPTPVYGSSRAAVRIAAVTLTLLVSGVAVRATQGWGELRLSPNHPLRGDSVLVEYVGASRFSGDSAVTLQAQLRSAGDADLEATWVPVAHLTAEPGGAFTGTFVLPPEVVYVTLTVSSDPTELPRTVQPRWELLTHAAGRPENDALLQRRIVTVARLPALNR